MSDYIWLSQSLTDVFNWRALMSDPAERDRELAIACGQRNDAGESLGPECFPTVIWPTAEAKPKDTAAADFFYAGTHWIVSGRFAELLGRFEMGDAHLYPVRFLQKDRETPVRGEYFCINFGNAKRALVPERSNSLRPTFREGEWTVKATVADYDVVFEAGVLSGGSIWKDPALKNVVCLAGPLGDAMRETGILTRFNGLGDMRKGLIAVG